VLDRQRHHHGAGSGYEGPPARWPSAANRRRAPSREPSMSARWRSCCRPTDPSRTGPRQERLRAEPGKAHASV
jgi:hypothetical protein